MFILSWIFATFILVLLIIEKPFMFCGAAAGIVYMNIPSLDQVVLKSLEFFIKNKPPKLAFKKNSFLLAVGSGNAFNTAKILFSGAQGIIADESNFASILKSYQALIKNKSITQAIVLSASGAKDSVWELEAAKKAGLKTKLLTCTPNSPAAKIADESLIFRKIAEPYTYNVSTYLGMILAGTGEDSKKIIKFIKSLKFPKNFKKYQAFSFVLLDSFSELAPMLEIKGDELFGPHLSLRAFPDGHARHAKFVNLWDKELIINIGKKKFYYGDKKNNWSINLPASAGAGLVMALTYYIVGKIQSSQKAYFKDNIERYCDDYGPKAYGKKEKFSVIVAGN